ncbi:MAG: leucine-rich repeat protein [Coriobacteriales bacterium]|jgi:hypothetical protein|nr:leucine-rich repeat protein [Coriobacteriales bacterium]
MKNCLSRCLSVLLSVVLISGLLVTPAFAQSGQGGQGSSSTQGTAPSQKAHTPASASSAPDGTGSAFGEIGESATWETGQDEASPAPEGETPPAPADTDSPEPDTPATEDNGASDEDARVPEGEEEADGASPDTEPSTGTSGVEAEQGRRGELVKTSLAEAIARAEEAGWAENPTSEEPVVAPLATGDTFRDNSDEGISVLYQITGSNTVQVGTGRSLPYDSPDYTVTPSFTGTISIPESVEYQGLIYKVTAVADFAFYPMISGLDVKPYSVSVVNVAEGISIIGSYAFSRLNTLEEFVFPRSVSVVGSSVFESSIKLASVSIPEGGGFTVITDSMFAATGLTGAVALPSQITTIGSYAFSRCLKLRTVSLAGPVSSIGSSAFSESGLIEFLIPRSLRTLGNNAFSRCGSLNYVGFESNCVIAELPSMGFAYCTALEGIEFPASLRSIETYCFWYSGLTSVSIPATLTYLGSAVFMQCLQLAQVDFDASSQMMNIQASLFQECPRLYSINLPNSIRSIGNSAFQGCTSLVTLQVPRSTTSLGSSSFQECLALRTVVFRGDASRLSSLSSTFALCDSISAVVYMGKKSKTLNFFASLPTVYYTIAFYNTRADALDPAVSPRTQFILRANSVPETATGSSIYLGSIPAPPSDQRWIYEEKSVGEPYSLSAEMTDSFYAYAQAATAPLTVGASFTANTVEQVPVSYTVTARADGTRPGTVTVAAPAIAATTMGAITVPEQVSGPDVLYYTVTALGAGAFQDCSRFVTITIPKSVTSMGAGAFARCTNLTNIYFASDASKIVDNGLFFGCSNIRLVVFGGKKANLSFGVSNPTVYYTVVYYDSKHDRDINNRAATLVVKQRALLDRLAESDVRSGGPVPPLALGFGWAYEEGFGGDIPLADSCVVFADGIGFKAPITIRENPDITTTDCWFKILSLDEEAHTGTVAVGLGVNGAPAIHQSIKGVPVIPPQVSDMEENSYQVIALTDYAFGASTRFESCQYITGISLSSSITSLGTYAFAFCQRLASITVPAAVASMGDYAFANCSALKSAQFANGSRLSVLPVAAFASCGLLVSVNLPSQLTQIGDSAFERCLELRAIALPGPVRSIGNGAFLLCYNLGSIELPVSLERVGERAYQNCSAVSSITFNGNASSVTFGNNAFNLYRDREHMGVLTQVVFRSKKSSTVTNFIQSGGGDFTTYNEYGRNYYQYFTITFYRTVADFNEGRYMSFALVCEDLVALGRAPYLGSNRAWRYEPGYSLASRTTDSYYAYGGYDLSQARVSGVEASYDYTGAYIKPVPVLTMPGGTVLRLDLDYVFDSSVGIYGDGYANNRRQGTASIHLIGINDYAGQNNVYFNITGFLDSAQVMDIQFLGANSYVYDGAPKTPQVRVTITFRGQTTVAREGADYILLYRNNVNANAKRDGAPAQVVVRGRDIYTGEALASFNILQAPLARCDISGSVTVDDAGTRSDLTLLDRQNAQRLAEGEDYALTVRKSTATTQAFVSGQGNYSGLVQLGVGRSIGTGGGGGGGTGTGVGLGSGPGNSLREGGQRGTANAIGLSFDGTEQELGTDVVAGGEVGGGGSGGQYVVFAIGSDTEVIDNSSPEPLTAVALSALSLALVALVVGGIYRYRYFVAARGGTKKTGKADGHGPVAQAV